MKGVVCCRWCQCQREVAVISPIPIAIFINESRMHTHIFMQFLAIVSSQYSIISVVAPDFGLSFKRRWS
jgi:hypothetical protein